MLLDRLRKFREETERRYIESHQSDMPSWQKDVMKLHEASKFLFYFDEFEDWDVKSGSCKLLGDLVKGNPEVGTEIYLYTGQAEPMAIASLREISQDNEQKRSLFMKEKKYILTVDIISYAEKLGSMLEIFQDLERRMSLLSDYLLM